MRPGEITTRGLILGVLTLATGIASAQSVASRGPWDSLSLADPGRSDIGPLGVEARRLTSIDLRQDWDFETLYQGHGVDGQTWFARRNAGITAIFPRSVYTPTREGQVAIIPPDTTFVIGEPSAYTSARLGLGPAPVSHRDASGGLRLDGRISLRGVDAQPLIQVGPRQDQSLGLDSSRRGVAALLRLARDRQRRGY